MGRIFGILCCLITALKVVSSDNDNCYMKVPHRVGKFGAGRPIYGIHVIKDKFYLVRDSSTKIEVFNAVGLNEVRADLDQPIAGMNGPYDLVGTVDNRKLFITDWFDASNITVASLKAQKEVMRFPLNEPFTVVGLAAGTGGPGESHVIVTCAQTNKIKEYTCKGELVREVTITGRITSPRHTIKLKDGRYVTCHGYGTKELHRVCVLSPKGEEQVCFGGKNGTGEYNLDVPSRVLEDANGNILVADRNNKRIVLLSPQMKFLREVATAADELEGPSRLFVDGPILYVADNKIESEMAVSGKVLMFRVRKY